MKQIHFLICSFLLCYCTASAQTIDHSKWTDVLQVYVAKNGNVNYRDLQNNRIVLNDYLNDLASNSPKDNWSNAETKAYWINAYNAYTIQLILDNYPLKSIKDLNDPWDQTFFKINGETMSGSIPIAEYVKMLTDAGFGTIEIRARKPYRILDPLHYNTEELIYIESIEVAAIKDPMPTDGPCVFTGKAAIYYGKEAFFDDEAGHVLVKNQPLAICDKTAAGLQA